ncbi:MAG: hypothetical protein ACR2JU_00190 [Nocardioidaceae bacterium]
MSTQLAAPLARACRVLDAPRSTAHYRRRHLRLVADGHIGDRPGPVGTIPDEDLVGLIRRMIRDSPFAGEGYRKIQARLRRDHDVHVSGKRVLRLRATPAASQPDESPHALPISNARPSKNISFPGAVHPEESNTLVQGSQTSCKFLYRRTRRAST